MNKFVLKLGLAEKRYITYGNLMNHKNLQIKNIKEDENLL